MTLFDILKIKFPSANFLKDIILQDEGQGPYIAQWNLDSPEPSLEELLEWQSDSDIIAEYNKRQAIIINTPIYDQLKLIDLKSIRALREGDEGRLDDLEAQAVALRAQLVI